jgi:hypothetical protein
MNPLMVVLKLEGVRKETVMCVPLVPRLQCCREKSFAPFKEIEMIRKEFFHVSYSTFDVLEENRNQPFVQQETPQSQSYHEMKSNECHFE